MCLSGLPHRRDSPRDAGRDQIDDRLHQRLEPERHGHETALEAPGEIVSGAIGDQLKKGNEDGKLEWYTIKIYAINLSNE